MLIESLTQNRAYYIRPDGDDANDGMGNDPSRAFRNPHAAFRALRMVNLNGFDVNIYDSSGAVTDPITVDAPWIGQGSVNLYGSGPSLSSLSVNSPGPALFLTTGARLFITGYKTENAGTGPGLRSYLGGVLTVGEMDYGYCGGAQIEAGPGGFIFLTQSYTISGGGTSHWHATAESAQLSCSAIDITISGTPHFDAYFAGVNKGSIICWQATFYGSATGTKFVCHYNGTIDATGRGIDFLPGDVPGRRDNGGIYIGSDAPIIDPQTGWAVCHPMVAPGSGAFGSVWAEVRYKLNGTICHMIADIRIFDVGSAAGYLSIRNLPFRARAGAPSTGINVNTGVAMAGYIAPSGCDVALFSQGAFPASGHTLYAGMPGFEVIL